MAILKHEVIEVTPELAKEWLGKDVIYAHQRDWRTSYSDGYASDMLAGLWSDDVADPIVFSKSGKLLNGQRRLHAIVQSGVTLSMLVVTVENESGYKFTDTGHSRTFSDLIGKDVKNKTQLGSVSKRIAGIEDGALIGKAIDGWAGVTLVKTVVFAEQHMDYLQSLVRAAKRVQGTLQHKGAVSSYGFVLHVFENVYGDGTVIQIEERVKDASEETEALKHKLRQMYAVQAPRASASGYVFAQYCDAILNNKKVDSLQIGTGMRILKALQSEYECGRPMDEELPKVR